MLTGKERCNAFVDPLIEHPALIILLDLILLKPRVFLHLLYNRGSAPYHAVPDRCPDNERDADSYGRERQMNERLWQLGALAWLLETATRLLPHMEATGGLRMSTTELSQVVFLVAMELAAQHVVTMALALAALRARAWWPVRKSRNKNEPQRADGRRLDFLPQVVPLTLLYTSIVPSLLQLVLSIWSASPEPPISIKKPSAPTFSPISAALGALPSYTRHLSPTWIRQAREAEEFLGMVWQHTDHMWAGTRLLGGMSAGFGLRVVLPTSPGETTVIILAGWAAASAAGRLLLNGVTDGRGVAL